MSNFQPLGSVADLFDDGDWVESKDQDASGEVRLIQLADVGDGYFVDKSNRFMNLETAKKLNCTFLKQDDVLIARMPDPLGRCCLFPFDEEERYVTVVDVAVLRIQDGCSKKYISYMINAPQIRHDIAGQVTGTTRQRITRKKLHKLEIPLPPLAEQQKIAAILDAADQLRQKDQQLIDHYTALSQSLFLEMFGDPVTNPNTYQMHALGKLCEDLFLGLTSKVDYVELGEGIPLVRAKDINTGELNLDNTKQISVQQHNKLTKNHLTQKGDLLVSKSGTLGTCAIVKSDIEFSTYESIFTVRPKLDRVNLQFLISILRSEAFKKKLLGNQVGGTVAHLNLKMFRKLEFPIPTIDMQNVFSKNILLIERQKQQAQTNLKNSTTLFNSLLQRAFKGELTSSKAA